MPESRALKILVAVKRVEDPESKIRVNGEGDGIVTEGVNYKINPFDEIAVEEALRLRERHGGEVAVVTIGTERSATEVRATLAMGADRGILVKHGGPLDALAVSAILARVCEMERPDLVLLGKQAIDDDQGQVGPYLAERLGAGQATCASKLDGLESEAEQQRRPGLVLSADGHSLRVVREVDGGVQVIDVDLPAVVTTDLRLNKPRFASLPGILKAKKRPLQELPSSGLGVPLAPAVMVKRLADPPRRKTGVRVADVEELYEKLHAEAKVL